MKYFLFYLIVIGTLSQSSAQTAFQDTILEQFHSISHIVPFENQTFLLAGKKGNVRLMMTNDDADNLWTLDFADFEDTRISKCEINYEAGDTTIHLLLHPYECDIIPPGIARLYTIGLDGTIRDTMFIPYEFNPYLIHLLSGNPEWPKYALFRTMTWDSLFVDLYYLDGRIESILSTIWIPTSIDIMPSSDLIIQREGHPRYRRYKQINGKYEFFNSEYGSSIAYLKIASNGSILLYEPNYLILHDSLGQTKGTYPLFNMFFHSVQWKAPYFYIYALSEVEWTDTLYIFDANLNLVFKDLISNHYPYPLDFGILNERLYTVGYDFNFAGGHIESKNIQTLEGPLYFDVELLDFKVSPADTAYSIINCFPFTLYKYQRLEITIQNHSDRDISNVKVSHGYQFDCCPTYYWEREIENMDLSAGTVNHYVIEDVELFGNDPASPFEEFCLDIFQPDLHADDQYENNSLCLHPDVILSQHQYPVEDVHHYPDPSWDDLYFISTSHLEFDITIFDFEGRHMLSATAMNSSSKSLDISMLSPGMYLLQYHFLESGYKKQTRFVKI